MTQSTRGQEPQKVFDTPITRGARIGIYDKVFFGLGTLGALWLAVFFGGDCTKS